MQKYVDRRGWQIVGEIEEAGSGVLGSIQVTDRSAR